MNTCPQCEKQFPETETTWLHPTLGFYCTETCLRAAVSNG